MPPSSARCAETAAGLERFLEALAKEHPEGEVYFVHTPLHASWMNQVEVWFSILQRRVLKHGSFSSKATSMGP